MRISALFLLAGPVAGTAAMAQDRRPVEEIVRSLDEEKRMAALNRDIPALERL